MKVSSSMEVVNVKNELVNKEKLVNTKVFVIDKMGKIYANGIINGPLRHRDHLLEIAGYLYPGNEISAHIDEGNCPPDKIGPFNVAYFFSMMGFTVVLNSPSMEGLEKMPKYLCILEANNPSLVQRESLKFCLSYFDGYCTDYATDIVAEFVSQLRTSWNKITFDGSPEINPLEAYESYLEEQSKTNNSNKLSLKK